MLRSSLWVDREGRSLFVTALLMAELYELREPSPQLEVRSLNETGYMVPPGWYGLVPSAGPGIVRLDGFPDTEVGITALERLCAPDPESRSRDHDGRRMARIDGGYLILNYIKHRDKDHTAADRQRRFKARKQAKANALAEQGNALPVTHAEDRVQSSDSSSSTSSSRETLLQAVPNRRAWEGVIAQAQDGMLGAAFKATDEQIERACLDYIAGNHHLERPTPKHFRAFIRNAVAGESAPPRAHGKPNIGEQTYQNAMKAIEE